MNAQDLCTHPATANGSCMVCGKRILPPLGVPPEDIWQGGALAERRNDLARAIVAYIQAGLTVKPEWVDEYNRHQSVLNPKQEPQ